MAEPPVTFASLLRKLRREARLTQEELAEAAALSVRAVSYLESGMVTSPQKDTGPMGKISMKDAGRCILRL